MFLNQLVNRNKPLAEFAFSAAGQSLLLPDTYLIDLDTLEENAAAMLRIANENRVKLYFMLKQLGRNPDIGKRLTALGFAGAVCVDFRDALMMMRHGIPIGNVGHLVQIPRALLKQVVEYGPEIITVYTAEKAQELSDCCISLGKRQAIMLRVVGDARALYPGQVGGFPLGELAAAVDTIAALPGVRIAGVCSFPCMQFHEEAGEILPTENAIVVQKARELLAAKGYQNLQINLPSATCCASLPAIAALGGTHAEPGHGLTGTTPLHAQEPSQPERPAMVYLSEVSHQFADSSYCYGGGRYSRGHLSRALVGTGLSNARQASVTLPSAENIDYHFELDGHFPVSTPVVMCFRTQIFITRSHVALVEGLSKGAPRIRGIYDAQGHLLQEQQ